MHPFKSSEATWNLHVTKRRLRGLLMTKSSPRSANSSAQPRSAAGELRGSAVLITRRDTHGSTSNSARILNYSSGSQTLNVLPRPGPSLDALTCPPCSSTSALTKARPRPRPPWLR
jgi:hypothetical protein